MTAPFFAAFDPIAGDWIDTRQTVHATAATVPVEAFRQAGDVTDGPMFRRAAAAVAAGTVAGQVRLRAKTYTVNLATATSGGRMAVPMSKGVQWVGPGRDICSVKLADAQGNYQAIFGPDTQTADLSGSLFEGFTIDCNAANNPLGAGNFDTLFPTVGADIAARRQIQVKAGRGFTVRDMGFPNLQAVWAIDAAGGVALKDITVERCRFAVGHPSNDYDHTTVYYHAGGTCRLIDNDFYSTGIAGRQAFELHGGKHVATGNHTYGYPNPWCATGSSSHGPMHGTVSGNGFYGAAAGADLWSQYGAAGAYGIDGLTYTDNIVELDHAKWAGSRLVAGFSMNGGSNMPMRGVLVEGNQFRTTTWGTFSALDVSSCAFNLTRFSGTVMTPLTGDTVARDIDLVFRGNIIDGMACGGLRYRNPNGAVDGLVMENNRFRNIAKAGATVFDGSNQALHYLNCPTINRWEARRNRVHDPSNPRKLTHGTLLYQVTNQGPGRDDGGWIQTGDATTPTDGRPVAWQTT